MDHIGGSQARGLAHRLVAEQGLVDGSHGRLETNLAHDLSSLSANVLEPLEQHGVGGLGEAVERAFCGPTVQFRALKKLERDVRHPYTDAQVHDRVKTLEARMRAIVAEHVKLNSSLPHRLWVCGSLAQGHFGANSDTDLLIDGGRVAQEVELASRQDVDVHYLLHDEEQQQLAFFGTAVPIDPRQLIRGESVLLPLLAMPSQRYTVQ